MAQRGSLRAPRPGSLRDGAASSPGWNQNLVHTPSLPAATASGARTPALATRTCNEGGVPRSEVQRPPVGSRWGDRSEPGRLATCFRRSLGSLSEPSCGLARTRCASARDRHPSVGGSLADRRMAFRVTPLVPEGFRCVRLAHIAGRCGIRSSDLLYPGEARRWEAIRFDDSAQPDRHINPAVPRLERVAVELDRPDRCDRAPSGLPGSTPARRHLDAGCARATHPPRCARACMNPRSTSV
jgi:hypothetical protein